MHAHHGAFGILHYTDVAHLPWVLGNIVNHCPL